jgi:hypothetical protein
MCRLYVRETIPGQKWYDADIDGWMEQGTDGKAHPIPEPPDDARRTGPWQDGEGRESSPEPNIIRYRKQAREVAGRLTRSSPLDLE